MVDAKVTTLAQQKQLDLYEIKRANLFKGTIAVCAVYGAIALIVLLITIFTEFGKTVLADTMFAFTTTFIAGMILIVVILGISVTAYEMPDTNFSTYNTLSCPDYYKLEKETPENIALYNTGIKNKMTYKCVADTSVWGVGFGTGSIGVGTTTVLNKEYYTGIGTAVSNNKCNTIFPLYLSSLETDSNPTDLHCKWSKLCNVPWSSACSRDPSAVTL